MLGVNKFFNGDLKLTNQSFWRNRETKKHEKMNSKRTNPKTITITITTTTTCNYITNTFKSVLFESSSHSSPFLYRTTTVYYLSMIPSKTQSRTTLLWTMLLPALSILFMTINLQQAHSFHIIRTTTRRISSSSIIRLSSFNPKDGQGSGDSSNEFAGFNPFEKKKTQTRLNPLISSNSNISLRQLRMKELMNTLLQNVSLENDNDKEKLVSILEENSELLLEPLVEENAMVDEDSIYEPGMNQEERFDRYDEVMGQRIEKATNKSVRKILSVMREYVAEQR